VAGNGTGQVVESPLPGVRSPAAKRVGSEGMVTVWDEYGRYLGCMGIETWLRLVEEEARRGW